MVSDKVRNIAKPRDVSGHCAESKNINKKKKENEIIEIIDFTIIFYWMQKQ